MADFAAALFVDPAPPGDTRARILRLATEAIFECDTAGILTATATEMRCRSRPRKDRAATPSPPMRRATPPTWRPTRGGRCSERVRSSWVFAACSPAPSAPSAARALNLYAALPAAFGAASRAQGMLLSVFAGIAIAGAAEQERVGEREANMWAALRTRELIGQAQGILVERERITGDQAFALLRASSQHLNVKLREVARSVVETGERPVTGPPPPPGPA